eukprot:CAMPEP_0119103268 /NCGR_PEP_ID=MMETSP1180-20130426/1742_1 /TAXON_ID=3052 ORGANISM="Chlamydomonas cf sp, Strain CCMP681" /NCGR_SAMPLE_ID=MMETSP1180 /ASSEMBLY_ACC=CAM_ASM_000741 /LENGTH=116 /DNA_ID=CAMNT_0007087723 /DNA_START=795 /DNA_END=1142 /DNA_ORIENTATION=-
MKMDVTAAVDQAAGEYQAATMKGMAATRPSVNIVGSVSTTPGDGGGEDCCDELCSARAVTFKWLLRANGQAARKSHLADGRWLPLDEDLFLPELLGGCMEVHLNREEAAPQLWDIW